MFPVAIPEGPHPFPYRTRKFVPIPNTEVKPSKADVTAAARQWESRTLPGYNEGPLVERSAGLFFSSFLEFIEGISLLKRTGYTFGHPEALVTDLSTIGDFGLEDDERCAANAKLGLMLSDDDYLYEIARAKLGLMLSDDDYLYEIARRLRDKGESRVESSEARDY